MSREQQPQLILVTCSHCDNDLAWTLREATVFCPKCKQWSNLNAEREMMEQKISV